MTPIEPSQDHRGPLLALLRGYRAAWPDEAAAVDRIVGLVQTRVDCFDRTCRPGHLTGSAWVVSADGQRHVLLHHRKLGKWLQPGGHADGEADVAAVARREAEEETGLPSLELVGPVLDVDVHTIPARHGPDGSLVEDAHEHHDVRFLFRASGDETLTFNAESHAVAWHTDDEVRRRTDEPSVLRLMEKARRRLSGDG